MIKATSQPRHLFSRSLQPLSSKRPRSPADAPWRSFHAGVAWQKSSSSKPRTMTNHEILLLPGGLKHWTQADALFMKVVSSSATTYHARCWIWKNETARCNGNLQAVKGRDLKFRLLQLQHEVLRSGRKQIALRALPCLACQGVGREVFTLSSAGGSLLPDPEC